MTSDMFRSPILRWAAVPVMAMAIPLVSGGLLQAAHIPGHGPIPSPAQCH
jgi:hypothetical protein